MKLKIVLIVIALIIASCKEEKKLKISSESKTLFNLVPESKTNIHFTNSIQQNVNFNFINYMYAFIGGGVAVGDINNDGLKDIYFTSNQNQNKLYLNEGDFKFKDITTLAGIEDSKGWSTGVSMIDINNDGWLDIYVCKSASLNNPQLRRNKLFINQKDNTFKEEAKKWGLDNHGFSIQSYFFDYDKDGDLDMYLVNHPVDFGNTNYLNINGQKNYNYETTDHFYRNDGDHYVNTTNEAKIANKAWGLSASIGDFNGDDWLDIYIANDYIEPDKLFINNKDGSFTNEIVDRIKHISYSSMGSDLSDINNDMLPDLFIVDMLAEDHLRSKENMPTMKTDGFNLMIKSGYHYQYMTNVLQLNNGNGTYSEIGQLAGISKTDWSWAPLVADFDNDGYKDVFISNGIERDISNQDYRKTIKSNLKNNVPMTIKQALDMASGEKLSNYIYKNNGDLTFSNKVEEWGLNEKINTNGVAYADLDNDGDLDLVLNNMSDKASIYKNNSSNNYISIQLKGSSKNRNAIGAQVKVFTKKQQQSQEMYTIRGYLSTITDVLNFGLGKEDQISKIEVIWPDNTTSILENIKANQTITISKKDSKSNKKTQSKLLQSFSSISPSLLGIDYIHQENDFNDFDLQVLLPQKQSALGPALAVADINNDGLDDFYIGGSKDQAGELYIQNKQGKFDKKNQPAFNKDKIYEDQKSMFFDADGDKDLDLYITSGGYEFLESSNLLQDRLYLNNGKGNFKKSTVLPKMYTSTKGISTIDFDNDGDKDLLIGGRLIPGKYPEAPQSYLLKNENKKFVDITNDIIPDFEKLGLVNDILVTDYDSDGDKDIFVVGEWMPITLFKNNNGSFVKENIQSFKNTDGWWNTITGADFDNDGDEDYIIGNLGNNNKFHPSLEKPLHIYGNYFDDNKTYDMVLSKNYKGKLVPLRGKECSSDQTPFINNKIKTYKEFANSTLDQIYGEEKLKEAYHLTAKNFSSVFAQNNGDGSFTIKKLPSEAQKGPTMAFEILDVNNDGNLDVIGIGAIHETEVETIRYDANTGYILLGDGKGNFKSENDISFYADGNVKDMKTIKILGETHFIIANNNSSLQLLKLKN